MQLLTPGPAALKCKRRFRQQLTISMAIRMGGSFRYVPDNIKRMLTQDRIN